MTVRKLPLLLLCFALWSCSDPILREPVDCQSATFDEAGEKLARCLPAQATAEDAADLLRTWQLMNDERGAALAANLLPANQPQLVVSFHADLANAFWNPQGKLVVLERNAGGWSVQFETPDPINDISQGTTSFAGNWEFMPLAAGDVTGDGLDDLLLQQRWSNGTHGYIRHVKLLTTDTDNEGTIEALLLNSHADSATKYQLKENLILETVYSSGRVAITHTLTYDDGHFTRIDSQIDEQAAQFRVTTATGAWYLFKAADADRIIYYLSGDELSEIIVDKPVSLLKQLDDNNVYAGTVNGAVLRLDRDRAVDVLEADFGITERRQQYPVVDVTRTASGALWVASGFQTARYDSSGERIYDQLTSRLLIAPDQSVWAIGWDGRADSNCCYFHFNDREVDAYQFDAALPVAGDFAEELRNLRNASAR